MLPRDHHHRLRGLQVAQLALVPHHQLVLPNHIQLLPVRREPHREVQSAAEARRLSHDVRHLPPLHLLLALPGRLRGLCPLSKEDLLPETVHSIRLHPPGPASHCHPIEPHDPERLRGPHLVPFACVPHHLQ